MNTQAQPRQAAFPALTDANGPLPVPEAMRQDIEALRRSGGADTPTTERLAVRTLAHLFRLTDRQAWSVWISHAATVAP